MIKIILWIFNTCQYIYSRKIGLTKNRKVIIKSIDNITIVIAEKIIIMKQIGFGYQ